MPNIGALLKQEIQRLAARVSRSQGESTRRTVIAQRKQIATLRAQIVVLEKQVASLQRGLKSAIKATPAPEKPSRAVRPMKATAIRAMRARLGITASQLAKLVGVTDQSIYNWEHEKSRPKVAPATALVELKGLGKRQVRERLEKQA
jgi:DNA-binding XRE family transcriptional regulator